MSEILRIIKYASKLPDELEFVDEHGKPYDDMNPFILTQSEKMTIATLCVKQKQSPETVINRALRASIRKRKL